MSTNLFSSDLLSSNKAKNGKNSDNFSIYTKVAYYEILNLSTDTILDSEIKKKSRNALRKEKENIAKNVIRVFSTEKDINIKQQTLDSFEAIYKRYFVLNDYSTFSFCESNTSDESIKLYTKMFQCINDFKKPKVETTTKETTKKATK